MSEKSVLMLTPKQIVPATLLCILAQKFMPTGKRFGLMVWGSSGVGKNEVTDKLPQVLNELAKGSTPWRMVEANCAGLMPEDVEGLPMIKDGKTVRCPVREWDSSGKGIFRIDEMDRPVTMQTLISLAKYAVDRTAVNPLSLDWFVLAMGNGCSDRHTVELTEHLRGRFVHIYVSINTSQAQREFADWLVGADADPSIQALHRLSPAASKDCFKPHAIDQNRTRMYASCLIKAYRAYGDILRGAGYDLEPVLRALLAGAVGMSTAMELIRLMEFAALPTLGAVVNDPLKVEVVADLSLACRYVNALADFCGNAVEARELIKYFNRYPAEIGRMGVDRLANYGWKA